jgi:GDPmannose 4,6-dehydratase
MKKKIAFILGITGQDGSYMSNLLLKKNYLVYGYTRSLTKKNLDNLKRVGTIDKIILKKYNEKKSFKNIIDDINKIRPNEIYYFAGQSAVSKSFVSPISTYSSNISLLFKILDNLRINKMSKIKFYNSCSTDIFGDSKKIFKNEKDLFTPHSPYGNAKKFSFWLTKYYRETYQLNCKSGILSNHESPLRKDNFVSKILTNFLKNRKKNQKLKLGNTAVYRDWGWAPEFVEAIYKINNSKFKKDYVVGTGKITSLKYIIERFFYLSRVNMKFIKINTKNLKRPNDIKKVGCNPKLIYKDLKWKSKINIDQIIQKLLLDEIY